MQTAIRISADGLSEEILNGIKTMFRHKTITIHITDNAVETATSFETEQSIPRFPRSISHAELLDRIERFERGETLPTDLTLEEFRVYA